MNPDRSYTPFDRLLMGFDQGLQTVFGRPQVTERKNPAENCEDVELDEKDKQHTARLMRINHTGEVCAQALYQGQALTAKLPEVREGMERAAAEENDHLDWCEQRIYELNGRKSLLNPIWYGASFGIGAIAGALGDKWSLGFVAETEYQVEKHLIEHMKQIPAKDEKTQAILEQMREDEVGHAHLAENSGAAQLPLPIKFGMKLTSKVMTKSVYWV